MTRKQKTMQKQIERLMVYWRPLLGLSDWVIRVHYSEKKWAGSCVAYPQYEEADIYFNLPLIASEERTREQLEDLVVHEHVHCIIWKSSERAVSQVTRSLIRARDLGLLRKAA